MCYVPSIVLQVEKYKYVSVFVCICFLFKNLTWTFDGEEGILLIKVVKGNLKHLEKKGRCAKYKYNKIRKG